MKRAFVLTTLLAVAGAALAQTHVLAEAQLPDGATKMIVRDYLSPATVSYIATASQNFFAYADAGNLMRCMPLDSRYDVRDMKILDGNVYFCGHDIEDYKAFLGWFNVTDVLHGNDGYHIFNNFSITPPAPYTPYDRALCFNQLEVFKDSYSKLHIALVGNTVSISACALHISETTFAGIWKYIIGYPQSHINTETMTNIVQNDNYIITGGTLFNDHEAVSMRFFKKDSMFTSAIATGNIAYRYTGSTDSTAIHYPRTKFAMATIDNDHVATASFWSYPHFANPTLYNSGYDGLIVNIYNISATIAYTTIPTTVHSVKSTYFQPISSSTIERMIYSPTTGSLYVLSQLQTPYGQQSLISEVKAPPISTVSNTYPPDCNLSDIDNFYGPNRYVSIGLKNGSSNKLMFYSQPTGCNPICAYDFSAPVTKSQFACKAEEEPLLTETHLFVFSTTEPIAIFNIPIRFDCQH